MRGIPYLRGDAAYARHAIAASWVAECSQIVEIGGGQTPITDHLVHRPSRVVVIDPTVVPRREHTLRGETCEVEHVAARFQDVPHDYRDYALVMLGFGLRYFRVPEDRPRAGPQGRGLFERLPRAVRNVVSDAVDNLPWPSNTEAFEQLARLVDGARVTVIGVPAGWWLSELQLRHLLGRVRPRVDLRVEVDLLDRRIPRRFRRRRLVRLR